MTGDVSHTPPFYFGTYLRPSHNQWDSDWNNVRYLVFKDIVPWDNFDGGLNPNEVEGCCSLHHKDGWTALAFANRSDDSRLGSNSVFFFRGLLTFGEAVAQARKSFPQVVDRFKFDLQEMSDHD